MSLEPEPFEAKTPAPRKAGKDDASSSATEVAVAQEEPSPPIQTQTWDGLNDDEMLEIPSAPISLPPGAIDTATGASTATGSGSFAPSQQISPSPVSQSSAPVNPFTGGPENPFIAPPVEATAVGTGAKVVSVLIALS